MIENQCESNCECVETQRSSGNNNVANECCEMTNKTNYFIIREKKPFFKIVLVICSMFPIVKPYFRIN